MPKSVPQRDYEELLAAYYTKSDELDKARALLRDCESRNPIWACGWIGTVLNGRCVRLNCEKTGPCTGWPQKTGAD